MSLQQSLGFALREGTDLLMNGLFANAQSDLSENEEAIRKAGYEAEQLLLLATGLSRVALLTGLRDPMTDDAHARFHAYLNRRLSGEPLQYILGEAPFFGRDFTVRPGCLIPRPETEVLVDEALRWLTQAPDSIVLDFGCGSGAIAVTIKAEQPAAHVAAVDISPEALAITKSNAERHGVEVSCVEMDGLAYLDALATGEGETTTDLRPNLLVSNPPYIPAADILQLAVEVRDYEPRLALDGGRDGLDFYRSICGIGDTFFADGPAGILFEVGYDQAEIVCSLFQANKIWNRWTFRIIHDLRGVPRVVKGIR